MMSHTPLKAGKLIVLLTAVMCTCGFNVKMNGALVAEPCVILPGDEDIQLDLGSVVDKYLYLNQRTHGQAFQINLSECDLSLGKTVRVTFSGNESTQLPGLLAIDASSQASGIAIGIETPEGMPLPINEQGGPRGLFVGKNRVPLKAYIQGEPQAITGKKLKYGSFNAISIFSLEYE